MKKTLIVLVMAVLAVSLFVSCNNSIKEPATYTVTLKYDEETSESFKVLDGEKFVLPESKGDKAIASFKDGEATYTAGERIAVKKDMVLTVVFKAEPTPSEKTYYSVVVISKDAIVDSQVVESGKKYKLPAVPSGTGFKGWQVGDDTTIKTAETEIEITANTVVKAVWEAEKAKEYFTVVVISEDSVVDTAYLEKDSEYALPAAPEGTGFNGWKVGEDTTLKTAGTKITITADTTVKADWTAESAPVYYSLTVISKEEVKESKAVVSGTKYTLPTNSETGFKTWSVNGAENAPGTKITVSANTTVKAVFEAETPKEYFTVVVISEDSVVDTAYLEKDSEYALPAAPEGTGFNGWKVGEDTTLKTAGTKIKITADTTVKADWTAEQAPVYYSLVVISKEDVIESKYVVSGTKYTLPTNSEARFKTWSVNGTETATGTEITVSSDTTVKAVFEAETPVTYYAVVVLNGDALVDSKAVAGNSTYTLPTAPSGEGTFKGWKVGEATELEAAGTDITINGNTTITAEWGAAEPAAYKIGDTGPGGGIIFYVADTPQESKYTDSSGAEHKLEWKYLEIAKADVSTSTTSWGTSSVSGTGTGIGTGWSNTKLLIASSISNFPAAQACTTYSNNGYSDWFLPSYDELALIYTNIYSNSEISAETKALFETTNYYWTSSIMAGNYAYRGYFTSSYSDTSGAPISMNMYYVRPIRAFTDTGSSSETITPASDYTVGGTVYLGTYPTDGKAISWKVLKVDTDNSRALVISENILEKRAWEDEYMSYAGSGIQEYLNDSDTGFIYKYGLKDLNNICSVDCNGENTYMSEGSSEKVFLLSAKELKDNFTTISKIANYQGSASAWWLRTFDDSSKPEYVDASGAIGSQDSSDESGVRPAMWVTF